MQTSDAKPYPTLTSLKNTLNYELSQQKAELPNFQKLDQINLQVDSYTEKQSKFSPNLVTLNSDLKSQQAALNLLLSEESNLKNIDSAATSRFKAQLENKITILKSQIEKNIQELQNLQNLQKEAQNFAKDHLKPLQDSFQKYQTNPDQKSADLLQEKILATKAILSKIRESAANKMDSLSDEMPLATLYNSFIYQDLDKNIAAPIESINQKFEDSKEQDLNKELQPKLNSIEQFFNESESDFQKHQTEQKQYFTDPSYLERAKVSDFIASEEKLLKTVLTAKIELDKINSQAENTALKPKIAELQKLIATKQNLIIQARIERKLQAKLSEKGQDKYFQYQLEANGEKGALLFQQDQLDQIGNWQEHDALIRDLKDEIKLVTDSVQSDLQKTELALNLAQGEARLNQLEKNLGEKSKLYFEAYQAFSSGNQAQAAKLFSDYLKQTFTAEENQQQDGLQANAKENLELLNKSSDFYQGLDALKNDNPKLASQKFNQYLATVGTLTPEQKNLHQAQIESAQESLKSIGLKQINLIDDLFADIKDLLYQKNSLVGNPELKPETAQEAQSLQQAIQKLRNGVISGEITDFYQEFEKVKTQVRSVSEKAQTKSEDSVFSRLEKLYSALETSDPKQKQKALIEFAQEARQFKGYSLAKKYLNYALEADYQRIISQKPALITREQVKDKLLNNPHAIEEIKYQALRHYAELKKHGNLAGLSLDQISQKLFENKITQGFQTEIRRILTEQGAAGKQYQEIFRNQSWHNSSAWDVASKSTEQVLLSAQRSADENFNPALLLYNEYFKEKPSDWYNPTTWGAEDYDQFQDDLIKFGVETFLTAGVGVGAGAAGSKVGQGVINALARRGVSKATLDIIEQGGYKALRQALNQDKQFLKSYLLHRGASLSTEGATIFALGTMQTGLLEGSEALEYQFQSLNAGLGGFGESIAKAALYRIIGQTGNRLFQQNPTLNLITSESFSGIAGTALEASHLHIKGQGEQADAKFWFKNLIQNTVQAGAMHSIYRFNSPSNSKETSRQFLLDSETVLKATNEAPALPLTPTQKIHLDQLSDNLTTQIHYFKNETSDRFNSLKLSEEKANEIDQKAWQTAYLDQMTGHFNRQGFDVAKEFFKPQTEVAIASFDGDYFGAFNKLKGNEFGDQIIKQMGINFHQLQQKLKADKIDAVIIREGGEEFTVIAKDMNAQDLSKYLDQFRQDLQKDIQGLLADINPQLKLELIHFLQLTGKLPLQHPAEFYLQDGSLGGSLTKNIIGGSTIGISSIKLGAAELSDQAKITLLDQVKRTADSLLEHQKTKGRNTVIAEETSFKKLNSQSIENELNKAQNKVLQKIFEQFSIKNQARFNHPNQIRGWTDLTKIIKTISPELQRKLTKELLSPKFITFDQIRQIDPSLEKHLSSFHNFQKERLHLMQIYDPLTGTLNAQALNSFLKLREDQQVSVDSFNLDLKLKPINEVLGHIGGDAYLSASAQVLQQIIKDLPHDFKSPQSKNPQNKIPETEISIFRKAPTDGAGFRLVASQGVLTEAHLNFIQQKFQQGIQEYFFQKIDQEKGLLGKSTIAKLESWTKKYSANPESDQLSLANIEISQDSIQQLAILKSQKTLQLKVRDFPVSERPPATKQKNEIPFELYKLIQQKDLQPVIEKIQKNPEFQTEQVLSSLVENLYGRKFLNIIPKLELSQQLQSRVIDRMIGEGNKILKNTKTNPEILSSTIIDLIVNNKIDIANPKILDRLLHYDSGITVIKDLFIKHPALIEKIQDFDQIVRGFTSKPFTSIDNVMDNLLEILEKADLPKPLHDHLSNAYQIKKQRIKDSMDFLDNPQKSSLILILKEDLARQPEVFQNLEKRDPQAYQLLKKNAEKLSPELIAALIKDSKVEYIDFSGQKITAYQGEILGRGGFGQVVKTIFFKGNSMDGQIGALKIPHEYNYELFRQEAYGHQKAQKLNHDHLIKSLSLGHDYIILETSENARIFTKELPFISPLEALNHLKALTSTLQMLKSNQLFHGDLKSPNIMIMDSAQGRQLKLIDLDLPEADSDSFSYTQELMSPRHLAAYQINPLKYFSALDAFALGDILAPRNTFLNIFSNRLGETNVQILKQIGENLRDLDFAIQPNALFKTIEALDLVIKNLQNPDQKPELPDNDYSISEHDPTIRVSKQHFSTERISASTFPTNHTSIF